VNFQIHRADVTLTDNTAPTFEQPPSGPLVDASRPLTGSQQVFAAAPIEAEE
jgi:hypothetical protein